MKTYNGTFDPRELKRLFVHGITLEEACPDCGKLAQKDLLENPLYYPEEYYTIGLWCDRCDREFVVNARLTVSVKLESGVTPQSIILEALGLRQNMEHQWVDRFGNTFAQNLVFTMSEQEFQAFREAFPTLAALVTSRTARSR